MQDDTLMPPSAAPETTPENPPADSSADLSAGSPVLSGAPPPSGTPENIPPSASPPSTPARGDIFDTTTASFIADVIEASKNKLVLVDFWAPWCGPCKQLTPILESVIAQSGGQVALAKMNIDEHPQIAQQLKVQSIPAVFAFKDGQPVDGFMGALPESDVKKFIEKNLGAELAPSDLEQMLADAHAALEKNNHAHAIEFFNNALDIDAENVPAIAGLAQSYIALNDPEMLEAAQEVLKMAPAAKANSPELAAARAALELVNKLADRAENVGATDDLRTALKADANNHQARFDLALALHADGDKIGAIDALLEIVALHAQWNDEAARKQLIELFDAYGASDEAVIKGRRKLSSLLFR